MKNNGNMFLILTMLMVSIGTQAQNIYSTQNGMMEMDFANDTYRSKDLRMLLDYDAATYKLEIDLTTLQNSEGENISDFVKIPNEKLVIEGKLGVEFINTTSHPAQSFNLEGIVVSSNNEVGGNGKLEHLSNSGTFSCILTIRIKIGLDDLGYELTDVNKDERISIKIVQVVLNRIENQ